MAKKTKLTGPQEVTAFLEHSEHPLKAVILELRRLILDCGYTLTEGIKWNAPSFCLDGEDRITFKLHPPREVSLVFHRGVKKRAPLPARLIDDSTGLLAWAANDRALATFTSLDDVEKHKTAFVSLVRAWLAASADGA